MSKKNKFFTYIVFSFIILILLLGIFIFKYTYNIPNDDTLLKSYIENYLDKKVSMPLTYNDIEIKEVVNIDNIKFVLLEKDRNTIGAAYLKRSILNSNYRIMSIEFCDSNFKSISIPTSKNDLLFFYGIKDNNYDIDKVELTSADSNENYSMKIPDKKFFVSYTYMDYSSGSKTSYDKLSHTIYDTAMNDITSLVTKTSTDYEFLNKKTEVENYISEHYLSSNKVTNSNNLISEFIILDKEINKDNTVYYLQGLLYDLDNNSIKSEPKDLFISVTLDKITSKVSNFSCSLDFDNLNDFLNTLPSDIHDSVNDYTLLTDRRNFLKNHITSNIDLIKLKRTNTR